MRTLQFEIEAVLVVEPLKEPVLFTSSFDSSRGEFAVEGE
jgi:predicted component of type VI protein secretion system